MQGGRLLPRRAVLRDLERHFPIPKTIDEKAVKATYKEGVLEFVLTGAVVVAEAKKQQTKAIPVEVQTPELAANA